MKNVSFGAIKFRSEGPQITQKQKKVIKQIEKEFGDYPEKYPIYGSAGTAEKAIEQHSNSDVFVIRRNDGNITLQLRGREDDHELRKKYNGKPFVETLNLRKSLKDLKEDIESIAQYFVDYTNEYERDNNW